MERAIIKITTSITLQEIRAIATMIATTSISTTGTRKFMIAT